MLPLHSFWHGPEATPLAAACLPYSSNSAIRSRYTPTSASPACRKVSPPPTPQLVTTTEANHRLKPFSKPNRLA